MYGQAPDLYRSRLTSAGLAALLQLAILLLIWTGFNAQVVRTGLQSALTSLDVRNPPPPPPPRHQAHARSGRAAPANMRAHAAPIVAPLVAPLKPPPVAAAIIAGAANQNAAGAASLPGPGSGAGGQGQGTGSGDNGDGDGSGGRDVELMHGRINDGDIPSALRNAAFAGTTRVEVAVGTRGQVTGCRTLRSSGSSLLDNLTCRLIFQRFRFRPTLDAQGRAQPDSVTYDQDWAISGQFGDDVSEQRP